MNPITLLYPDDNVTYDNLIAGHKNNFLKNSPKQWPKPDDAILVKQAEIDLKHIRDCYSGSESQIRAGVCNFLIFYSRDLFSKDAWSDFNLLYKFGPASVKSKSSLDELVFYGLITKDFSITERVKAEVFEI